MCADAVTSTYKNKTAGRMLSAHTDGPDSKSAAPTRKSGWGDKKGCIYPPNFKGQGQEGY